MTEDFDYGPYAQAVAGAIRLLSLSDKAKEDRDAKEEDSRSRRVLEQQGSGGEGREGYSISQREGQGETGALR